MQEDTTNYDQPHLHTHESKGHSVTNEYKRTFVTAFLCVYRVSRQYGGPEEGGWWYDAYEFTGAAFPFRAEQEYVAVEFDGSDHDAADWWDDDKGAPMVWQESGLPHVTDEPTRVRLESARLHFIELYGDPDAKPHRGSVRPRGEDYAFVYELTPGERGNRPRPRYC